MNASLTDVGSGCSVVDMLQILIEFRRGRLKMIDLCLSDVGCLVDLSDPTSQVLFGSCCCDLGNPIECGLADPSPFELGNPTAFDLITVADKFWQSVWPRSSASVS